MPYEDTRVAVEKSQTEIRKMLTGFDVLVCRFTSFPSHALLEFVRESEGQQTPYRVTITPKVKGEPTPTSWGRAERQVWRVAYWWLKSKLEAIEFGLVEFEEEMLPYMLIAAEGERAEPVAKVFFQRLAGRLSLKDDPFGGLQPALPPGSTSQSTQKG